MFRELAMTRHGSSIVATLVLTVAMLTAAPLAAQTTMPTPEALAGMSAAAKAAIKDDVMAAARAQPDQVTKQPMPDMPDAPVLLARGALRDADRVHKGSGSAGLYQLPDGGYLLRFEDFRTTNGPAYACSWSRTRTRRAAATSRPAFSTSAPSRATLAIRTMPSRQTRTSPGSRAW